MELIYSSRFKKDYKKLSKELQEAVNSKLKLFIKNISHPSLRTKKIQGSKNDFELSINMNFRIVWQYAEDKIYLKAIGTHDHIF